VTTIVDVNGLPATCVVTWTEAGASRATVPVTRAEAARVYGGLHLRAVRHVLSGTGTPVTGIEVREAAGDGD
jgi:hypothetical protein